MAHLATTSKCTEEPLEHHHASIFTNPAALLKKMTRAEYQRLESGSTPAPTFALEAIQGQERLCEALIEPREPLAPKAPTPTARMDEFKLHERGRINLLDGSYGVFRKLYKNVLTDDADIYGRLFQLMRLAEFPPMERRAQLERILKMAPQLEQILQSVDGIYGDVQPLAIIGELLQRAHNVARARKNEDKLHVVRRLAAFILGQLEHEIDKNFLTQEGFYREILQHNLLPEAEGFVDVLSEMLGEEATTLYRQEILPEYRLGDLLQKHALPNSITPELTGVSEHFHNRIESEILGKQQFADALHYSVFDHLRSVVKRAPISLVDLPDLRKLSDDERIARKKEATTRNTQQLWNSPEIKMFFLDIQPLLKAALEHKNKSSKENNVLSIFAAMRVLLDRMYHMNQEERAAYPKIYVDLYHSSFLPEDQFGSLLFDVDAYNTIAGIRPTEEEPTLFKDLLKESIQEHSQRVEDGEMLGEYSISHKDHLLKCLLYSVVAERIEDHYTWLAQVPVEAGQVSTSSTEVATA